MVNIEPYYPQKSLYIIILLLISYDDSYFYTIFFYFLTHMQFVESGIVRLGSFEGINTCDVLVLATSQPVDKGGGITYEEFATLTPDLVRIPFLFFHR